MTALRGFLAFSWVLIMGVTIYAVSQIGFNWPAVFFGDLFGNEWRSQFNTNFLIHLFLLCAWVYWREESKSERRSIWLSQYFSGWNVWFCVFVIPHL